MHTTDQDTIAELRRCEADREAEARAEAIEAQWAEAYGTDRRVEGEDR